MELRPGPSTKQLLLRPTPKHAAMRGLVDSSLAVHTIHHAHTRTNCIEVLRPIPARLLCLPITVRPITVVWALQELHSANEAQRALWSSSWLPHISAPRFHPKPVAPSPAKVPRRIQLDPGAVGMYAVTGVRTLSNHGSVTATSCHTHSLTCHVDIIVGMPIYLHTVLTSQDLLGLWNPSPYCTSQLPVFNHRP